MSDAVVDEKSLGLDVFVFCVLFNTFFSTGTFELIFV